MVNLDVCNYPIGHQFTVVKCDKCGYFYEPYEKEHKCKKKIKEEK